MSNDSNSTSNNRELSNNNQYQQRSLIKSNSRMNFEEDSVEVSFHIYKKWYFLGHYLKGLPCMLKDCLFQT